MRNSALPSCAAVPPSADVPLLLGALLVLAASASPVQAQESEEDVEEDAEERRTLQSALEEHRHPLGLVDGELSGPGGELLLREASRARYVLVGETHGVAETPALVSALFRDLQPAGYRHLAVEVGPIQAEKVNELLAGPRPMEAYAQFLADHWPGLPFYSWREEAELLADAVRTGGEEVLWGLDYDVLGDRYPLHRLRDLAPDAEARAAADRAVERADSLLERVSETGEFSNVMMFQATDSVWSALREAYTPEAGSEADRILRQLSATTRINEAWTSGRRWLSNQRRVRLLQENFLRYRREADPAAKVLVKMGGFHVMRGRTPNNTFDLGSLLPTLGLVEAYRSRPSPERGDPTRERETPGAFHVMVLGGPDGRRAAPDPRDWGVREVPDVLSGEDHWARPLAPASFEDRWTLFDLRPLRPLLDAGELEEVSPSLERMIFGFDAAVVLVGSGPARLLDVSP